MNVFFEYFYEPGKSGREGDLAAFFMRWAIGYGEGYGKKRVRQIMLREKSGSVGCGNGLRFKF